MDYNYNSDSNASDGSSQTRPEPDLGLLSRRMVNAAFACSIIAIILFFFCYLSIPLAVIAIILALLSRGRQALSGKGVLTIVLSVGGILLSGMVTVYAVFTVYHSPELKAQMEDIIDYYFPEYSEGMDDTFLFSDPTEPGNYIDQQFLQSGGESI
ncbi:MAG: hypothetical protein PHR92_11800 [Lachnospiraceae bacterium]|nr:hypothetical protein [Lachnospiraceae bacterium]